MCFRAPSTSPFEIYGISTASYAENKCSTYHRYASALFSASSLYLYRLFQKAYGKRLFKTATDGGGSKQERDLCYMHKSRRQNAQGWAGHKSETSFGTKLVLHRCTWTYTVQQSISKGLRKVCSETTRLPLVLSSSDVFALQKLAFKN